MRKSKQINIWAIIGIVCGVAVLIFGIVMLKQDVGGSKSPLTSFGGDFYTESYQATATAANNVKRLCDLVAKGFGFLLIALGLGDVCYFGSKVINASAKAKASAAQRRNDELPAL